MDCQKAIQKGCKADCCGVIPIPADLYEDNQDLFQITPTKVLYSDGEDSYIPLTPDWLCIFLDRTLWDCKVYEFRPEVCRKYGTTPELPCPFFDLGGKFRHRADRRRVLRETNQRFQGVIKEAQKILNMRGKAKIVEAHSRSMTDAEVKKFHSSPEK